MVASLMYLGTRKLKYDAFAGGVTEVSLVFATANLVSGMIWARYAWGIWWTWDARLTSMLVCVLMYYGYVMLRQAITEPTQRARLSAVMSIFGMAGVAFVYQSIAWYRTQHPSPVLGFREGGGMGPGLEAPMYWNFLAMLCLAVILASDEAPPVDVPAPAVEDAGNAIPTPSLSAGDRRALGKALRSEVPRASHATHATPSTPPAETAQYGKVLNAVSTARCRCSPVRPAPRLQGGRWCRRCRTSDSKWSRPAPRNPPRKTRTASAR